jgi:hypothetical protein
MGKNRDIHELPTKQFTHEHIGTCFYVEFDKSGQPLYRVSVEQVYNMIKEKALIDGMDVRIYEDHITISKFDDKEIKANKVRRAIISASVAIDKFKAAYDRLPDDIKNELN